jgi:Rrf2 family protein
MAYLARQPQGRAVPLEKVARRQRVKLKYLEQIFLKLRKANLVKSKKGPHGGYFIPRDPRIITLGDVIRAVGESTAPVLCANGKKDKYCGGLKPCPFQTHWRALKKLINTFFDTHTLSDVSGTRRRRSQ